MSDSSVSSPSEPESELELELDSASRSTTTSPLSDPDSAPPRHSWTQKGTATCPPTAGSNETTPSPIKLSPNIESCQTRTTSCRPMPDGMAWLNGRLARRSTRSLSHVGSIDLTRVDVRALAERASRKGAAKFTNESAVLALWSLSSLSTAREDCCTGTSPAALNPVHSDRS